MSDDESEYSVTGVFSDEEDERTGKTLKTPTFTKKKDKQNVKILHNVEKIGGDGSDEEDDDDEDEDEYEEDESYSEKTKQKDIKQKSVEQLTSIVDDSDGDDDEDDDEDDEDDDEEYFQKLDKEVVKNYLELFHPESKTHNYDEIKLLSVVTRNDRGQIVDKLHRTIPILTKFEKTRILGLRAKQLEEGAVPFVKVSNNVIDGYTIALEELQQKKIPFIIRRPLPNGGSEYWKLSDLEIV
jgi:DNA-directed RNA polymerase I, II, and III subunit RPABC2